MYNYDKKFIFNVLRHQIDNRLEFKHPCFNMFEEAAGLFWDSLYENGVMQVNKVKYPDIRSDVAENSFLATPAQRLWYSWAIIYADILMIHHLFDDDYSEENYSMIESMTSMNKIGELEGPYCFENVTVEEGDVVIDAGAYMGDWSALAAQMGGKVYAFEPCRESYESALLEKTAVLNNFKISRAGLGDKMEKRLISAYCPGGMNTVNDVEGFPCDIITLDSFAEENDIHIDFIKSDIEGHERYMLKGAARVLREDAPKLAIRTYHRNNGNDAEYLPKLIKELNPKYKLIERRKTVFAYVE
jgi:FkbM family methyltransferase